MGTRAVYTFIDKMIPNSPKYSVYIHWDGYPSGALKYLRNALKFINTSIDDEEDLKRLEMDDFAAGFIAANKEGAGSVYLTDSPDKHGDLSYKYEFSLENGIFVIKVEKFRNTWKEVFYGKISEFIEFTESL